MKTGTRERLEKLLLDERDRLAEDLRRIEEEEAEPQAVSGGAVARTEWTQAEAASDSQEQEADFMLATRASARLAEVHEALRLLNEDPDALARCSRCGTAIEPARLELVPWTRLCADCARAG
jgi:RNA polymerase-binding transcription factor DksA